MKKLVLFLFVILTVASVEAQVTGTVFDNDGNPVIGATVQEKGTYNGTITDIDGKFSLTTITENPILSISYTGFANQEVSWNGSDLSISLQEGTLLDEIVVTGSRGKPRTVLGSPVPIDNINAAELRLSLIHI